MTMGKPTPPERYKADEELTVDEIVEQQRASRRGETLRFETDEYRAYVRGTMAGAGLEVPDAYREGGEKPLEEMSPAEHFQRLGRR
jgi:hypothetical protein